MAVSVVFETHSWSEDNERGVASGWNHSCLTPRGRVLALELGDRRSADAIDAVFTSDLRRAVETVEVAFADHPISIFHDWRLRECNYGTLNGMPAAELHADKPSYVRSPYPGGESWQGAIERVGLFLDDLARYFDGQRVLLVGHVATYWAIVHHLDGTSITDLMTSGFDWKLGWEFELPAGQLSQNL